MDIMPAAAEVWDENRYPGLSGDRTLAATAFALDRLGYMVSQTLDDNVAELPQDYKGPDGDCFAFGQMCVIRSLNAVRVAYGHYENCGGIGILIAAMGRASLIPAVKVSGGPEDHEWNEIFMDDQWRPYQVDWSDGATRIDNPGNGQDRDYGGGKYLSMVYTFRGDGLLINNMDRYSHTVTFSIDVTDASGMPVDSAALLLATEGHYDPYGLMLATIEFTDVNGHAEFPVGDHQNFYLRIDSPAGWWPDHPDDPHVAWVACSNPGLTYPDDRPCPEFTSWNDTLPMPTTDATGEVIQLDLVLDGTGMPLLRATPPQQPPDATGAYRLTLDLDVTHTARDLPSLDTSETWYVLLENTRRAGTSYHYDMNLTFHTHQDAGVDGGTGGSGKGGCGCRSADGVPAGLPVLFLLLLCGLWMGRRRGS
jgi:MYXO-CTERM domain-containing protein